MDSFLMLGNILVVIGAGLWLLAKAAPLDWRQLTLPTAIWYAYIIFLPIPAVTIVLLEKPPNGEICLWLHLATGIAIPIGALLSSIVWGRGRKHIEYFFTLPLEALERGERRIMNILTFIAIFISFLFIINTPTIPLVYALWHPGDYHLLTLLRQQTTKELGPIAGYSYFMLRQFGWPLVVSCWFAAAFLSKEIKYGWIIFAALLGPAIFINSVVLMKSPVVILLLAVGLTYYLARPANGWRLLIGTVLVGILGSMFIIWLYSPSSSVGQVLYAVLKRIFYIPARMDFYYAEIYPEHHDFLWGRGIGKLAMIVNLFDPTYEYFPLTEYVYRYIYPLSPYRGSANTSFVGSSYANWGILGPPVYGLAVGFLLQTLQIWIVCQKKTSFLLAIWSNMYIAFLHLLIADFFTTLLSFGGLVLPCFLVISRTNWRFFPQKVLQKPFRGKVFFSTHVI